MTQDSPLPLAKDLAPSGQAAHYAYRLAYCAEDIAAAQRLRYEVFNLELNEGLAESHLMQMDIDPFDPVCDHLLILHRGTEKVVGTYRLQTGQRAKKNLGYYSEQEFDFAPFESIRFEVLELGRACVHRDHRNLSALHLLWRGIAQYAQDHGSRYFLGCSSLTSQDPDLGHAMYLRLAEKHLVPPELRTLPLPAFALHPTDTQQNCPPPPKLLRAYLALGAKICGPPALDQEFKTIDFLTLLDLTTLPALVRNHFLGAS